MTSDPQRDLRQALLTLHGQLLAAQVVEMEKATGHTMNPNEQLSAALGDPRFAWLRSLSGLIAAIDAEAADPDEVDPAQPPALDRLQSLLNPPDPDTEFGKRYLRELQLNPSAVLAHRDVTALLESLE
ncbi:MAG: hypothetical protein WCI34_05740 [Actinomycetes bacterium]